VQYWNFIPDFLSVLKQSLLILRLPNDPLLRLLPHDWTLSIEMAVSFLLPVLVFSALKNSGIVLLFIYVAVKFLHIDPFAFDFSIGIFLALSWNKIKQLQLTTASKWGILLLGFCIVCSDYLFPELMKAADRILIHSKSIGLAFLLLIILTSNTIQKLLSFQWLLFLGRISYSLYLIHLIILFYATVFLQGTNPVIVFTFCLSATILLAWISFKIMEEPFIRLSKSLMN
jgi:peptidoglycan/LPS O-acetylase OafA/YrhL